MLGFTSQTWAEEVVTESLFTSVSSGKAQGTNADLWAFSKSPSAYSKDYLGVQVGTSASPAGTWTITSVDSRTNVTKVVVTTVTGGSATISSITVGSTTFSLPNQEIASGTANKGKSYEFTGNASSGKVTISFNATSKAMYVGGISITEDIDSGSDTPVETQTCETPTFSVKTGIFNSPQSVEITCTTNGAAIYYTTDGTTPSAESTLYSGAISVNQTTTIKAIAIKEDYNNSNVASSTITIVNTTGNGTKDNPFTLADVRLLNNSVSGNAWVTGYILGSYASGGKLADPAVDTNLALGESAESTEYIPVNLKSGSPARQDLNIKDHSENIGYQVKVKGTLAEYFNTTGVKNVAEYEWVGSGPTVLGPCATPVFSPAAGTYNEVKNVTITCETEGADIYYTTDGSTPTSLSTKYTSPITVDKSMTIVAFATKTGRKNSEDVSAEYIINLPLSGAGSGTEADPYDVTRALDILSRGQESENAIFVKGTISSIKTEATSIPTYKNADYYISTDGTEAEGKSNCLLVFRGKGIDNADMTTSDYVLAADEVVICGNLKTYNETKELQNSYLVSQKRNGKEVSHAITLTKIEVTTLPSKTVYTVNEAFNLNGCTVTATYSDGTTKDVTGEEACSFSPADNTVLNAVGTTTITVTYGDKAATFSVTVAAASEDSGDETATGGVTETDEYLEFNLGALDAEKNSVWSFPSDYVNTATSYSNSGYSLNLMPGTTGSGWKMQTYDKTKKALLIGKKGASIALPVFDFNVSRIEVFGATGASANTTYNIYVGNTPVSEEVTSCRSDHSLSINPEYQAAGNQYVIKITNDNNAQFSAIKVYKAEGGNVPTTLTATATSSTGENPVSVEQYAGERLTCSVVKASGTAYYQWYSNSTASIEGSVAIDGADESTYMVPTDVLGTYYYYCYVMDEEADEAYSNIVTVNVVEQGSVVPPTTGGVIVEADGSLTFDFTNNSWGFPETNTKEEGASYSSDGYVVTLSATNNGWRFGGKSLIIGKKGTTITLPAFNFDVDKITFTGVSGASTNVLLNVYVGNTAVSKQQQDRTTESTFDIATDYQSAGNQYVIKIESDHNAQISTFTVHKADPNKPTCQSPTFSLPAGTYTESQTISLSAETGATIYYTTDGSYPTTQSTKYTGAITIDRATTIKAIAVKANCYNSPVAEAKYIINLPVLDLAGEGDGTAESPFDVTRALDYIGKGYAADVNRCVKGIVVSVGYYNKNYSSLTYVISTDGNNLNTLQVYGGLYLGSKGFDASTQIEAGDEVIVCGKLKTYSGTKEFDLDNYLVSLTKSVPVSSAQWATYSPSTNVILPEVEGAKYYYARTIEGNNVKYQEITSGTVIASGEGILINAPVGTLKIKATADEASLIEGNLLKGAPQGKAYDDAECANAYIFANGSQGIGFYGWGSGDLSAHKCYLLLDDNNAASIRFFGLPDFEQSTSLEVIETKQATSEAYNILGQRINTKLYRGIVIKNGKKNILR